MFMQKGKIKTIILVFGIVLLIALVAYIVYFMQTL